MKHGMTAIAPHVAGVVETSLASYDPTVLVSVVIVNWNGREHLDTCLNSLQRQTLSGVEILVVDNGSADGSVAYLRDTFSTVQVLANEANWGYGRALNAGIRRAQGHYLFALNNDTEVHPGCLAALLDAAERHPEAGSFAPKILSFSDRRVIDNVGHLLYPDGLSRGRGRLEIDHGQYDREEDILIPSGCAVLLRREMLVDIGLFDEDLFAYCEDTDLGLRGQLAGWRSRYVPAAVVYHKYSASTDTYSPTKAFLVERNRVWVAAKCLPLPWLVASPLFTLARLCAQVISLVTGRGAAGRFAQSHSESQLALILVKALLAATAGLPRALRKRREVQQRRRISTSQLIHWFTNHRMTLREIALKD
ncbi:MAG TPA: glycosyltransferase family 2 protein [Candidatus Binatia bacterium]|nr:glycosyltransferase family 2 protein [Candidatus Binatia bacterium]